MNPYLSLVLQGKNQWWRFALALAVIGLMWLIVGSVPVVAAAIYVAVDNDPSTYLSDTGQFAGVDPLLPFIAIMASFALFLAGIYLAMRYVHQRPLSTLITPASIRWGRLAQAFGLWFLLAAVLAVLEALLYPGRYVLTFDPVHFLTFLIPALLLTPIQTTTEELFFRGYLLQGASLYIKNTLGLCLTSGLVFMLVHLSNVEVISNIFLLPLFYFAFGAFMAYLTIKDNGLELALGIHAANNLFTGLFANYAQSSLGTPAIFTVSELDAVYNVISVLIAMAVLYLWFFWPERKPK